MDERLEKIQKSSYLLPDPGGEVVRGLVDEVDRLQGAATAWFGKARDRDTEIGRLRLANSRQKEYLNKQIDGLARLIKRYQYGSHRYVDLTDEREQLIGIREANYRIAKELNLDERVHTEPTEYTEAPMEYDLETGVPILPMPEFCTAYSCVSISGGENWEGGKHNCIGDETRRLVKNDYGFLICPTCNRSYGGGL